MSDHSSDWSLILADRQKPPPEQRFFTDGAQINYVEGGSGTRLVVVRPLQRHRSVSLVVQLLKILRYTTSRADVMAMFLKPATHRPGLVPVRSRRLRGSASLGPPADPAAMGDEVAEAVAEPVGITLRQVDLILDAIKAELDGLGGVRAVEIVLENGHMLRCHAAIVARG